MQFIPLKTRPLLPPHDDLFTVLHESLTEVQDGDIVFITSKIVAIHQGRCISTKNIAKKDLIKQEADYRAMSDVVPGKDIYLTIKDHILIPSAGIDESNANGYYILRPENLPELTKQIHQFICQKFNLTNLGIIITDSTTRPLRWGVVGIGIYAYGINPLIDKRGSTDLFGRKLEISQVNVVDALSAMAVYLMGEADESTPLVLGRNIPHIEYTTVIGYETSVVPFEQDLFHPLLQGLQKSEGNSTNSTLG